MDLSLNQTRDEAANSASASDPRPSMGEIVFQPGTSSATFMLRLPSTTVVSKVELDFGEGHRKSVLPSRLKIEAGNQADSMVTVAAVAPGPPRVTRSDKTVASASCKLDYGLACDFLRITISLPTFTPKLGRTVFLKGARVVRGALWAHGDDDGGEGAVGIVLQTYVGDFFLTVC